MNYSIIDGLVSVAAVHQGEPPWLHPAYCFDSVIVWTENKNVSISDRFICYILTVKQSATTLSFSCVYYLWGFIVISAKWTEWTGRYYVFTFVCVCLCTLSPIGLNGRNDVLYCVRLVHEKLRIFPYRHYIDGMFHWLSDDIVRFKIEVGVDEKCTKM